MHDDRSILEGRLARVLRDRLRPAAARVLAPLELTAWHVEGGGGEPVPPADALSPAVAALYAPFAVGEAWGPAWGTTWFRLRARVPDAAHHRPGHRLELVVDLGWRNDSSGFQAEGLVYRPDGVTVKGLNPRNQWIPVTGEPGAEIDLYLEAAANPQVFDRDDRAFWPTDLGEKSTAGAEPRYRLRRADLVVIDETVEALVTDLEFLGELMAALPEGDTRRWTVLRAVDRALDLIDPDDVAGTAAAARAALAGVLGAPAAASAHRVSAVGHAHIDSAWLWPIRETVRKVARTTANVLNLMESRPELVFAMSSAQQWQWLRDDRPELFERLRARALEGRVVPVGGMWVESDTTMVGGEAMVRQFLEGTRFFEAELGIRSRVVWLPDSFGYSAALPQIVRLAGFEYFLTQKISWNQVNVFPHHTFSWVGIDGTEVFTHFPPADTYNGDVSPAELLHAASNYREKGSGSRSLLPFGFGDGGGGPVREMLDRAQRSADVEGLPRVRIETPEEFFDTARAELPSPARWFGELYLELHRGTLTSQAAMKRGNRRSEHLLREAELWAATAAVRTGLPYPVAALREAWQTVLLQQFHDILPGSSIAWVHREARERYAEVAAVLEGVIATSLEALANETPEEQIDGAHPGSTPVVFNPRPHAVDGVPAGGAAVPQRAHDDARVSAASDAWGWILENDLVRVRIDASGSIVSVVTLADGREAIAPGGRANLLQLHDDKPVQWDAWDLDSYYRNTVRDLDLLDGVELDGGSPQAPGAHATVRVRRSFGASTVEQEITLRAGSADIELVTRLDWQEREKILKLAFPIDVHAERARFETQFGHLARPIHENTSWDAARFEVAAHRWVHLGEPIGVALANDATYGHEVRRVARAGGGMAAVVRVSLLRAPLYPDPETDLGRHEFRHTLVPSATIADAVRAGYDLNLPLRAVGSAAIAPLVALAGDETLRIEAVKLADDGSGDVIVRLYESLGTGGRARVVPGFAAMGMSEQDLLERPIGGLTLDREPALEGDYVTLRPFQIVTLRIGRA
ncbi:alpha-mannosidase [Herbiconiux ginsengi]|uniref:Alpha-mannosidase n=1 Tax=Herbiconiux ginsengi TaxID=381665 RepID=A0A1H3KN96_9MICO|nr:glycoside hydrolase family 38 C-terminal domain-containing protein [Herbiconiux ginsengi]SDY53520.1 alpha-mannosidase [Herbiconiux ginsengi]